MSRSQKCLTTVLDVSHLEESFTLVLDKSRSQEFMPQSLTRAFVVHSGSWVRLVQSVNYFLELLNGLV